jgi:hypothetical protein
VNSEKFATAWKKCALYMEKDEKDGRQKNATEF